LSEEFWRGVHVYRMTMDICIAINIAFSPTQNTPIYCRTPVWLKTAFTVLVQEGGGYWCMAGARKRKIGARVGLGREK